MPFPKLGFNEEALKIMYKKIIMKLMKFMRFGEGKGYSLWQR